MEDSKEIAVPLSPTTDFKRLVFYGKDEKHMICPYREMIGSLL